MRVIGPQDGRHRIASNRALRAVKEREQPTPMRFGGRACQTAKAIRGPRLRDRAAAIPDANPHRARQRADFPRLIVGHAVG